MIIKPFMKFWEEEGGEGGGGVEGNASVADILGDTTEGTESTEGGEAAPVGEGTAGTKPATANIDLDELTKKFGAVIGEHIPKVSAPAAPKLTAEEAKKLLKHFDIDDSFIQRFGDIKTQKDAFAEFRDKLVMHIDTITQLRQQEMQQVWEARFTPVQQMIEQRTVAERESRFNTTFPQLANPQLRPLLGAVAQRLHASGQLTDDESANFSAIAKGVEAVIQATNPQFKLDAKASATKKANASNPNAIPVTSHGASGGGGGGGGGGNQGGGNKPKLLSLLPQIK